MDGVGLGGNIVLLHGQVENDVRCEAALSSLQIVEGTSSS